MIGEREVHELLRAATDDIAVPLAPAEELAAAGRRRVRRGRVLAGVAAAAAVAAVSVGVPVVLSSQGSSPSGPTVAPTTATGDAGCVGQVPSRVLPSWARTGFSDPRPRMPYLLGDNGDIAAILFVQPLAAPPSAHYNNKILWVSRVATDGSALRIHATLQDGSPTVTREVVGGPGPSIVNLPTSGCWHLTLQWAGHTDSLDLAYVAP